MPRPKLGRVRINITLPKTLLRLLDAEARRRKMTRSDLIEDACAHVVRKRR
jgi:metal-responsive CopG/Arc/MetJ family transcriptional regulator